MKDLRDLKDSCRAPHACGCSKCPFTGNLSDPVALSLWGHGGLLYGLCSDTAPVGGAFMPAV